MNKSMHPKRQKQKPNPGFTLVELLAVMAVIAILAGFMVGLAGFAGRKTGEAACVSELEKWRNLLEDFKAAKGYYPGGTNALTSIETALSNTNIASNAVFKNYFNSVERDIDYEDPWGVDYYYQLKTRFKYRIGSTGPDGKLGDNTTTITNFGKFDDITNENGRLN